MTLIRNTVVALGLAVTGMAAPSLAATIETFDDAVPAGFITDRYEPAGFEGGVLFQGDNRLRVTIAAEDAQAPSPSGPPAIGFYNTQGKKKLLSDDIRSVSLDLYVDAALAGSSLRRAGLWEAGIDYDNALSNYGILEISNGAFQYYDSDTGAFATLGSGPLGVDQFYTLSMVLNVTDNTLTYSVAGVGSATISAYGTKRFSEAMIQGYNSAQGESYSFLADNLTTEVPEPGMIGLLGLGALGLGLRRRRAA